MAQTSNLKPLSQFLADKARDELNEDPATRLQAISDLKEAYKAKHPELPLMREDDLFIIRFLRARKYDMERAVELTYNFHKFAKDHADRPQHATLEEARPIIEAGAGGIFPCKSKSGASIILVKASNLNPDTMTLRMLQYGFVYLWGQLLEDEATQICGALMIQDLSGFSLSSASKMRKLQGDQKDDYHFLQNCLPLRFKGVHLVHEPWYVSFFMSLAKPFMSKKLSERFYHHGTSLESLEKYFNVKELPKILGGEIDYVCTDSFEIAEAWHKRTVIDK